MYTRSICLYVHMCYMYMHVLTHCRYPHIQILHCKVPYSPVHQGDPWAVPQHCDECSKFLSLATWTDRARERERGREIPWDTPEQRKAGRKAGKKGGREEATHKCYDVGRAATSMDELIHKPMNQPINQWIDCVYVPDNFAIHVTGGPSSGPISPMKWTTNKHSTVPVHQWKNEPKVRLT